MGQAIAILSDPTIEDMPKASSRTISQKPTALTTIDKPGGNRQWLVYPN
jgi:hypothetical protein